MRGRAIKPRDEPVRDVVVAERTSRVTDWPGDACAQHQTLLQHPDVLISSTHLDLHIQRLRHIRRIGNAHGAFTRAAFHRFHGEPPRLPRPKPIDMGRMLAVDRAAA